MGGIVISVAVALVSLVRLRNRQRVKQVNTILDSIAYRNDTL